MHVKKPSASLSMPENVMNSDVGYVVVKFTVTSWLQAYFLG